MMFFAWLFSTLFSVGGLALGWTFDLPAGAMVVVLAGGVFLAFAAFKVLSISRRRREPCPREPDPAESPEQL